MTTQIDPRHRPLRGLSAISKYLNDQHPELTRRQIARGMVDASFDGKVAISTPARIDNSPLITGAPPIENPARPPRRVPWSRERKTPIRATEQQIEHPKRATKRGKGAA
jgi:hypothetical protein